MHLDNMATKQVCRPCKQRKNELGTIPENRFDHVLEGQYAPLHRQYRKERPRVQGTRMTLAYTVQPRNKKQWLQTRLLR